MKRAGRWRGWGALALLALGVVAHAALLGQLTAAGSEAVGVALGPGTPAGQVALMLGFVGVRAALFLGGPALVVLAACGLAKEARAGLLSKG